MHNLLSNLLVRSFDPQKPVPDMRYTVFSGTLNPTQSINLSSLIICYHLTVSYAVDA